VKLHTLLTLALDGDERSTSRPDSFTSEERVRGTHWIRGYVGSRSGLDVVVNW